MQLLSYADFDFIQILKKPRTQININGTLWLSLSILKKYLRPGKKVWLYQGAGGGGGARRPHAGTLIPVLGIRGIRPSDNLSSGWQKKFPIFFFLIAYPQAHYLQYKIFLIFCYSFVLKWSHFAIIISEKGRILSRIRIPNTAQFTPITWGTPRIQLSEDVWGRENRPGPPTPPQGSVGAGPGLHIIISNLLYQFSSYPSQTSVPDRWHWRPIRILLFSSMAFKKPTKNLVFSKFFLLHTSVFDVNIPLRNSWNQGF